MKDNYFVNYSSFVFCFNIFFFYNELYLTKGGIKVAKKMYIFIKNGRENCVAQICNKITAFLPINSSIYSILFISDYFCKFVATL